MAKKKKLSESVLGLETLKHLKKEGWDCYPEATLKYGRGRADLAATKDGELLVVELKTSLSLALLSQANEWVKTKAVDYVIIGVPFSGYPSPLVMEILKWKGIGLFQIQTNNSYAYVRHTGSNIHRGLDPEHLDPSKLKRDRMIKSLHPDMKRYTPGSSSGYSTPYNRTIIMIREYLEKHGSATMKDIVKLDHHYSSDSSARSSLTLALTTFESGTFNAVKEGVSWVFTLK